MTAHASERHLGLLGATGVGVGAIVGGGILALAGVAFATAGPAAILAFGLNGAIAALTAASFAHLARAFPESGGTYTYAKKVMTVEVAFTVGWVVWFASIVAAVLYAMGFAAFAAEAFGRVFAPGDRVAGRALRLALALGAVAFYAAGLARKPAGGGQWATIGKLLVFALLIAGGAYALARGPAAPALARLDPFFPSGPLGLLQAMGYTFIALQGFDLIAAVGGEVRDPQRNLPRSMYLSLGIALAIYLPLLLIIGTVGVPEGGSVTAMAARNPEGMVAEAAEQYLGVAGWWLVVVAGVLSMLSALQANLYGASRVAFAMARDRTLPQQLGRMRGSSGTPAVAIAATAGAVALVLIVIPDVAAAGAASSLVFLVSFAMVHAASILARRRSGQQGFPALPVLGGGLCLALALFQGLSVAAAGALVGIWLLVGLGIYLTLLAPGAGVADAAAEAADPDLVRLRGRSPLVLVPIANPASAASLVGVAEAMVSAQAGRILLFSVVRPPEELHPDELSPALRDAQEIVGEALHAGFHGGVPPETLITISSDPWSEISRVARTYRCEMLLLGLSRLDQPGLEGAVERLIGQIDARVVVVRAPRRWRLADVRSVLVPVGGRRDQSRLRARFLGRLAHAGDAAARRITFLRVLPAGTADLELARAEREVRLLAGGEAAASPGAARRSAICRCGSRARRRRPWC